ncbi:GumC family protein [Microbulbifer hainanensis]|uniref:GumC family protein n=1 Tax=Microbulbifer hainanensis TaxID=2735675 RepID=UPI0018674831|nr:polysaccharide biosynthesis tyrosine autokinase [Microbulbifer hainanensis]
MESKLSNGYGPGQDEFVDGELVDLRKYWRVTLLHKWKIVAATIVFGAVAAAVLLALAPRYQATAILSFENGQANLVKIEDVYESGNQNRDYLKTQEEIIKSRKIIDRVIDKLNLIENEEFSIAEKGGSFLPWAVFKGTGTEKEGEDVSSSLIITTSTEDEKHLKQKDIALPNDLGSELLTESESDIAQNNTYLIRPELKVGKSSNDQLRNIVAKEFYRHLSVEMVRNTQLIKITFESESPESAARIANTIAQVYIEAQREAGEEVRQRATAWLNERLEAVRTKLEESEKALHDFQEKENLVDLDGGKPLTVQELNETTAQLLEARRRTQEISSIRSLLSQGKADLSDLTALPGEQYRAAIQDLKRAESDAERRLAELSLRYGKKHPKIIIANSEIASIRKQISDEKEQLLKGIENEYQAALKNERSLELELEKIKRGYQAASIKEIQHAELKRKVEIDRGLYKTFLTRVKETSEGSGFDSPIARLADPAVAPSAPVDNKLVLIVTLTMLVGVAISVIIAVLYEFLYDKVRGPDDVENVLGHNLFGVIPLVKGAANNRLSLRTYFSEENYSFAEAVRTLRTSLVLSHLDSPAKIIAITSSIPGEGKTTVSQCLAFSLAQMEKVLLIDADLRRSTIGRTFGLSPKRAGLTNLISGKKKSEECIYHDKASGLDVMPAGSLPPDAQRVLGSVGFANHIKLLSRKYERIIIDTPPVQAVSDALLISRVASATLYVIKSGVARKRVVTKGIERLERAGTSIDGVILSQVDLKKCSEYSSEYYGFYGDKYGYGAPDQVFDGDPRPVLDSEKPAVIREADSDKGCQALPRNNLRRVETV